MTRLGLQTVFETESKSKNWGGCREGWVRQIHQVPTWCNMCGVGLASGGMLNG